MKHYPLALAAVLSIIVMAAPAPHPAPRSYAAVPIVIAVTVTPQRLMPLDQATISATFSTRRPDSGPYTTTLELLPPRGGSHGPALSQGGFRLRQGQSLTVYWEWRAGASLPPGNYTVRVRLDDGAGHVVAAGEAPMLLSVTGQSASAG